MLPEPTFNSFLMLAASLLVVGVVGLFTRRGTTARLLALVVMASAAPLALAATDRYFGTTSGRLTAVLILVMVLVQAVAVVAVVLAHGGQRTPDE